MREFGTRDFCFAGGVALNCTANCPHDPRSRHSLAHPPGGRRCRRRTRRGTCNRSCAAARTQPASRYQVSAYLGVTYPEPVIKATLSLNNVPYRQCNDIAETLADELAAGRVVAILHGRDEWGPRAWARARSWPTRAAPR